MFERLLKRLVAGLAVLAHGIAIGIGILVLIFGIVFLADVVSKICGWNTWWL